MISLDRKQRLKEFKKKLHREFHIEANAQEDRVSYAKLKDLHNYFFHRIIITSKLMNGKN